MIGSVIIWITFASALGSAYVFFLSVRKKNLRALAGSIFHVSVAGVVLASGLLMLYILQHRFEYNYVASYSSRELPLSLLITTFWAGQEGSFMLWALFTAIIGLFLQRYTRNKGIEGEAMTVYSLIFAFLLLLISVKSPFEYVWDVAANKVPAGFVPPDGRGLNPLLQNFWMIIHPPVLFTGFASLAVPFVFAIAALWKKRYSDWMVIALPWVLFSTVALGTGLMLGGYWAYGVLGWGGWWGWDPVENSSLIPWIISLILVHTMVIQMLTGRLVRTNFVLAVLSYLLVVYSTFLTRSGVLANASVHSFVDPGAFAYVLLLMWLAVVIVGGFGLIYSRRKELAVTTPPSAWLTRESILSIAAVVMGVCATVILFGTSTPIFSNSTFEPSFYNNTTLPLAILMTLLLGLSLQSAWNQEDRQVLLKRLLVPALLSIIGVALLVVFGLNDIQAGALALASFFAFFISVEHGYRIVKQQPRFIGSALSHAGLAILLLAIIGSGRYGREQSVALPLNQTQNVLGYELTYTGISMTQDGKAKFNVDVQRSGSKSSLDPIMFESAYNNSLMRTPDYITFLTKDFYVEPVSLEEDTAAEQQNIVALMKDEPKYYGPMTLTFRRFDLDEHGKGGMMAGGSMTVGAVVEVKVDNNIQQVVPKTTYSPQGSPEMKTAFLKSSHIGFQLVSMSIPSGEKKPQVIINIVDTQRSHSGMQMPETLVAEVSVKPFMSLVWIAAALIVGGLATAMVRRLKQSSA
jgi:cytochrome c-type biogenesis protein CcmF